MFEFEKKKLLNKLKDRDILEILENEECIIAGGCITSLFTRREINDIDIYFRSKESLIRALEQIVDCSTIIAHTDKATLFVKDREGNEYQFIHFNFFESPKDIFNTFDFTVCMGAYDFKTEEFVLHDNFLKDNSQRMLKVNQNTKYPIVTALRIQKYLDKGYSISKPEFIKIMLIINKLKINTYKELKEQMGGMYGINYDKLFKDIQDDDNFDTNIVIEKLSDLILDDDYFNLPNPNNDYENLIKFINNSYIENENYKFYKVVFKNNNNWNNKIETNYLVINDKEIVKVFGENDIEILDNKLSDNSDIIYVYKNVKLRENKLYSFYNGDFEYKIGETVIAKNEQGLYFSENEYEANTYRDNDNSVLIKCIVKIDDYVNYLNFEKCIPVEIVKHNNINKKDSDN
ncbi:UNVERIFIED_ORG: hypothetical protein B2H93_04365 [Clostridium botulinum]